MYLVLDREGIFRYDFYDHGEVDVPLDFYWAISVNVQSQMKELEE